MTTAECKRISPDHTGPDCSCTGAACALDITETYDGEFEPLIDRDPGDETAAVPVPRRRRRPRLPLFHSGDPDLARKASEMFGSAPQRSYRATYFLVGTGNGICFRDFIGPDGFLHAVELAEGMREDGERLLNVRELT